MEKLKKVWAWFSGKKTAIGALILAVAAFISQLGVEASWVAPTVDALQKIGIALTGVGLSHKAVK